MFLYVGGGRLRPVHNRIDLAKARGSPTNALRDRSAHVDSFIATMACRWSFPHHRLPRWQLLVLLTATTHIERRWVSRAPHENLARVIDSGEGLLAPLQLASRGCRATGVILLTSSV